MDNEHSQTGDLASLCIADLLPVAGITDRYDSKIFALANDASKASDLHACCAHMRQVLNADTVYLCEKSSLQLITSSALDMDGNIHPDTIDIHDAITSVVTDLHRTVVPLWLPTLRVFPGVHKMSFLAVPVGHELQALAIIVDPENSDGLLDTLYFTDALAATCNHYASKPDEIKPERLEEAIFDELACRHAVSDRIRQRRFEIFQRALAGVTVQFEKILEFNGTGESEVWGWEAIARHAQRNEFPAKLYETAERWGDEFRAALDIHMLKEAAYRYKSVCEAEFLIRFADIKPLCIAVRPQSLCEPVYAQLLTELIERVVISGPTLVLELSGPMPARDAQPSHRELNARVDFLRKTFGIRIALDEFRTGRASLNRFFSIEPEIVKMSQSILTGQSRHMALELLQAFSQLSHNRSDHSLGTVMDTADEAANDESTLRGREASNDAKVPQKPDEPVEPA